jgi:hypothetical protein
MIIITCIHNWYHSIATSIHLYTRAQITMYGTHSPCFIVSPCAFPLLIPLAPLFKSLPLTWNRPCCDRIRPPRSPIACKLNSPSPLPCSYTPHSKIPTPRGFSPPNIHSLGRHREPGSQDPAQYCICDFRQISR